MKALSDPTLDHLRRIADWPDLSGTRYEMVDRLGAGGMGTVYLAYDRQLEREVALKVTKAFDGDEIADSRLLTEARILARLEHPGIIPVHDAGRLSDGRVFYAMKRVRGSRLDEYAQRLESIAEALRLYERICDTIAFAHAHGIIHRDLKPENVMVGSFGEVLILDWGVARLRAESATRSMQAALPSSLTPEVTADGVVLGTPGYMALEQARGEHHQLDQRADVYALGALLRFLLTGEAPEADQTEHRESGATGGAPRQWNQRIARPLLAICRKALAHEPRDRYATVAELSADVARFLSHSRVQAHAETALERAQRFASKHRTAIALVAAYLLIRVALLLFGRH